MVTSQLPLWSDKDATDGWSVRESQRARRLTVRVFHTGRVEVVVPFRTSARAVERFLERHRPWIERKREEARRRAGPPVPFPPPQIELPACAETWRIHLAGGIGRARLASPGPGLLTLAGDGGNAQWVRQALRRWLMERARQALAPLLAECAHELGFRYERVLVRRQRTRWGSCSTRGTVSLNCCLLFQRPPVVRYLMIHELVHTQHMNHSRRFWQCVARHCPEYRGLDRELLDGWRRVPHWVFGDEAP
ncbi:MAG TPA: SprT family zinc-dependent metalloprotease [Steroidobacteraceae bacterium]|nr:SprT family zinc-dependent metalloprotease [Steroidobacteraceae bacterium]